VTEQEIDQSIKNYLNNNNFVSKSNWNNVAMSQLFRVDMSSNIDIIEDAVLGEEYIDTESLVNIQDVISINIPAERYEYATQNLFNQIRNAFTAVTRDQFRLKLIDSSSLGYRYGFASRLGSFGKMSNRSPRDYYYNLLVRQIRKNPSTGMYEYTTKFVLVDCVTENISDIDYSVEKLNMITTEITGKFKTIEVY